MRLGTGQLGALVAVLREGSFERAARLLHVTPSAVSQRIRQLEEQVGGILVVRSSPCRATPMGEAVHRHALAVELLESDLMRAVVPEPADEASPPARMAIAVNADTLATWLVPALRSFARDGRIRVDVSIDDESLTAQWLRSGKAVGAVTSEGRPLQGCRVEALGVMRYRATASPRFMRRWLPDGVTAAALQAAPSLAYNRSDRACEQFLAEAFDSVEVELHPHYLPSPNAYADACMRGLGWGMNPQPLVSGAIKRGRLVDLSPEHAVEVPLYWQQWSISSPSIDALAAAVCEHAREALAPLDGD